LNSPAGSAGGVSRGLVEYTHVIYALFALSVLAAIAGVQAVALRFAFGLPSIIAVVMCYARRSEVRGSWLESHFRWQIHTFWYCWLWIIVASIVSVPLLILVIGIVTEILALAIIGIWVSYRVIRGWLALREARALPQPA
jgi:uncharacterized membrane protein